MSIRDEDGRLKVRRREDMHVAGDLFAMRFADENQVELYVEDDGNYFLKASFSRDWLDDLARVADRADDLEIYP